MKHAIFTTHARIERKVENKQGRALRLCNERVRLVAEPALREQRDGIQDGIRCAVRGVDVCAGGRAVQAERQVDVGLGLGEAVGDDAEEIYRRP